MNTYIVFWSDGTQEKLQGYNLEDAFRKIGMNFIAARAIIDYIKTE